MNSNKPTKTERPLSERLAPRQFQITKLVGEGCTNLEIARQLEIAERTVVNTLTMIYAKLGIGQNPRLDSRSALVIEFIKWRDGK